MKKIYTKETSNNKRYVQRKVFDRCHGINSNAVILAGPTPEHYIKQLINIGCKKIVSYEKEGNIYHSQIQNPIKNVKYLFGDISMCKPERFMDLDFCCWLESSQKTIISLFQQQKQLKGKKVFCFTISYMMTNFSPIISFLSKLLNLKITIYNISKSEKCTEYVLLYNSSKYIVNLYTYCDSSAMAYISIQYS